MFKPHTRTFGKADLKRPDTNKSPAGRYFSPPVFEFSFFLFFLHSSHPNARYANVFFPPRVGSLNQNKTKDVSSGALAGLFVFVVEQQPLEKSSNIRQADVYSVYGRVFKVSAAAKCSVYLKWDNRLWA